MSTCNSSTKMAAQITPPALIVLDIDQTLLHATTLPLDRPCDYKAERTWIYKRPHIDEFLYFCAQYFQIAVWTSARASFADEIFNQLFPYIELQFIYSEQHCQMKLTGNGQQHSVKPVYTLTQLGFNLKRVVVIDDSPEKHYLNPENLIPVKPYYAKIEDNELYCLKNYLFSIKDQKNFLCLPKRQWRQSNLLLAK